MIKWTDILLVKLNNKQQLSKPFSPNKNEKVTIDFISEIIGSHQFGY